MKDAIIGVIGLGKVGKSVFHTFSFYYETRGYDINGDYRWSDILESDIVFICVPTPGQEDGRLNSSIVFSTLAKLFSSNYQGIVVIKSTLGVGTMAIAVDRYPGMKLVYMPEFLVERNNFPWFVCPDRLVISGCDDDIETVLKCFSWVEKTVPIIRLSYREAEIAKLAHNAFIAVKVSFTNEIEEISIEQNIDPEKVMSVIWSDRRVKSDAHLRPNLGPYEGKCIPKDTRELIQSAKDPVLLVAAEKVNKRTKERYGSYK